MGCQMLFAPTEEAMDSGTAKIGVILFGGALVDPRSYSVLAQDLAHNYGIAVSIPIFENDVAFLGCGGTDRIPLAEWAFPHVEKWVLVGHSMGGIGLQTNVLMSNQTDMMEQDNPIGGMVLLVSYVNPICGQDFSDTNLPTAVVQTELDGGINKTNVQAYSVYLPSNDTFRLKSRGAITSVLGFTMILFEPQNLVRMMARLPCLKSFSRIF